MSQDPTGRHVSIHPDNAAVPFAEWEAEGWSLEIRCWTCKREVYIRGPELVRRFGPHGSTGHLAKRLKCDACGQRLPALSAKRLDR